MKGVQNKIIFELSPELRVSNTLSLEGPLAELFRPFARRIVTLSDEYGNTLMAMVNARGTTKTPAVITVKPAAEAHNRESSCTIFTPSVTAHCVGYF
ncbi:hypothetical protein JCM15765_16270 [Paradesulfitobacterium aromaticivorans]